MKVFAYIVVALLGLVLAGCTRRNNVTENIADQLRSGAAQVDIGRAADFEWDEMFVFGPYYPKDDICRTLKLTGRQCSAAGIRDVDETEFLLVFMQHGAVSETETFPLTIGSFDESEKCLAKGIGRGAAVFRVERKPTVYLVCR